MVKKSNNEVKNNMYNILLAEHGSTIVDDGIISNIEGCGDFIWVGMWNHSGSSFGLGYGSLNAMVCINYKA